MPENMVGSLWGDEFNIEETKTQTKKIISKVKREKKATGSKSSSSSSSNKLLTIEEIEESVDTLGNLDEVEKALKSKKYLLDFKLELITKTTLKVLGKQIDNVEVIWDKKKLYDYIDKGLKFGRISIDTETNNSVDPITLKIMGLCLYVKNEKQIYVPINHINKDTGERLKNELTEQDIHEVLQYMLDKGKNCKYIFQNHKFDYQVLKQTCGVRVPCSWDTLVGTRLLNENEPYGLKYQYISKIDPTQQKYDIEALFGYIPYAIIDPNIFALYAATDALMTDRLYEYQMNILSQPELKDVLNLALTLEIPLTEVFAELELNGVEFDSDYQILLHKKYHKLLDDLDSKISIELSKLKPQIDAWRLTPEANTKTITPQGNEGRTKSEQLTEPINLKSPSQLAILIYDILKIKPVLKDSPRATGEEVLEKIDLPLCKLLIKRRTLSKLIDSFIDALPESKNIDGRIHCHFNQLGADTGRQSSSDPNLQNIPADFTRLLFRASDGKVQNNESIDDDGDVFEVNDVDYINTDRGFKSVKDLKVGDTILVDNVSTKIKSIGSDSKKYTIIVEQ